MTVTSLLANVFLNCLFIYDKLILRKEIIMAEGGDLKTVNVWLTIKRYDLVENIKEEPLPRTTACVTFHKDSDFKEIQSEIRKYLGLQENGQELLKLRTKNGILVPLSYILAGSSENDPYIIEVLRLYQHALANGTIPQVVKDTVKHRFENLEKRVQHLEATIPDLKSLRMANIERVAEQLDYKVHFLNRRIDDLAPVDWKEKLQNSGKSLSPIQATN